MLSAPQLTNLSKGHFQITFILFLIARKMKFIHMQIKLFFLQMVVAPGVALIEACGNSEMDY